VRDACTGVKVPNLSVTVTTNPGPIQVPDKIGVGHFTFVTVSPGPQQLQVSAPGYAPLGDAAAPGVTITRDPGPINLPAPQQMAVGMKTAIFLAPNPLPASCPLAAKAHRPLNALVGTVHDATTNAKVPNLSVTVTRDPGPIQSPDKVAAGHFVYRDPGPISAPFVLQVSAPGYPALGDAAAPGVTITVNPGPISLPAVQYMSVGLATKILL